MLFFQIFALFCLLRCRISGGLQHLAGCPALEVLDLANNKIKSMDDVAALAAACPQLQRLDLSDNDVSVAPGFRAKVLELFPKLQVLNGKKEAGRVAASAAAAAAAAASDDEGDEFDEVCWRLCFMLTSQPAPMIKHCFCVVLSTIFQCTDSLRYWRGMILYKSVCTSFTAWRRLHHCNRSTAQPQTLSHLYTLNPVPYTLYLIPYTP